MSTSIQDFTKQLLELHALEERRNFFEEQGKDLAEVEALLAARRAQIPPANLSRHDRLREQGKRSVAECRQGVCSGCHMRVATGQVPALLLQDTVQTCEYCGRVLYVTEKQSIPAAAPAATTRTRKTRPVPVSGGRARVAVG